MDEVLIEFAKSNRRLDFGDFVDNFNPTTHDRESVEYENLIEM